MTDLEKTREAMMKAWQAFIDATRDYYEARNAYWNDSGCEEKQTLLRETEAARKIASEIYYAADKAYTAALAAQSPEHAEHVEVINGNRQLE